MESIIIKSNTIIKIDRIQAILPDDTKILVAYDDVELIPISIIKERKGIV